MFSDRDENLGADDTSVRMVPAQKRLHAFNFAIPSIHLGLVAKLQLSKLDSMTKIFVQIRNFPTQALSNMICFTKI